MEAEMLARPPRPSEENKIMKTKLLISGGLLMTFVGSAMLTQVVFKLLLH